MMRIRWPVGALGGVGRACVIALAVGLSAGCHPATAQNGDGPGQACAPPPPWREANAKPGQPALELAACLRDQAYETRTVKVPVESAAYGIVAQCEVRVDHFEGVIAEPGSDQERQAADREAVRQATAAVEQYRQCAGR